VTEDILSIFLYSRKVFTQSAFALSRMLLIETILMMSEISSCRRWWALRLASSWA